MVLAPQQLMVAVSSITPADVQGTFYRHTHPEAKPLSGSSSGGRWGAEGTYSVLYLGRPPDSVVVEAYRHLVDDDEDGRLTGEMVGPRSFSTVEVDVSEVLDLRAATAQQRVGLSDDALRSPIGDYASCQRVGAAAHQLGLHGVLATAATGLGETLALFDEHLGAELPQLGQVETWTHLPPDPRRLRAVRESRPA